MRTQKHNNLPSPIARRVLLNLANGRPGHTGLYPHGAHGTYRTVCAGLYGRGLVDRNVQLTRDGREMAVLLGGVLIQALPPTPTITSLDFESLTEAQVRALRIFACTHKQQNRATMRVLINKGLLVERVASGVQFAPGVEVLWQEWQLTRAIQAPMGAYHGERSAPLSMANQLALMNSNSKRESHDEHP